ncbi:hypothetical protein DL98DRAFT_441657 [Cadophora sp. DSE1049]|nr:hypothetical protein DL98DRAFT_441657 [Cadophora sp. DSE1049]
MYTGILENRMFVTVIECIRANGIAIPLMIIVKGKLIIADWFFEKMTGLEVVTVFESGYTNNGITIRWLDYFIEYNNCGPDKPWHLLLFNGQLCHEADNFILKAKANKIWIIKFPLYQTHLL